MAEILAGLPVLVQTHGEEENAHPVEDPRLAV
jgi:hypothetical protein